MFYVVGEWESYVYVFDTKNSLYKMVEFDKFKQSGVDFEYSIKSYSELTKLRVLYKFNKCSGDIFYKTLVRYELPFRNYESIDSVIITLTLYLVPEESGGKIYISAYTMYNNYYNPVIKTWYTGDKTNIGVTISGVSVPECMLDYIIRLRVNQDLSGIFYTFDNIFSDKIFLGSRFEFDSIRGISNVVWGKD